MRNSFFLLFNMLFSTTFSLKLSAGKPPPALKPGEIAEIFRSNSIFFFKMRTGSSRIDHSRPIIEFING